MHAVLKWEKCGGGKGSEQADDCKERFKTSSDDNEGKVVQKGEGENGNLSSAWLTALPHIFLNSFLAHLSQLRV